MTRKCLLLLLALSAAPAVFADGIYIPQVNVARLPGMPSQRAIIAHRDGIETLVVESPFEGEGTDLAWVLPVPAEPLKMEKATAGLFTTLELGLQPGISYSNPGAFRGIGGALLIIWSLFILAAGRFVPGRALLATLAVGFVLSVAMAKSSHMGPTRTGEAAMDGTAMPGVTASAVARVGNYDVQTVQADSSARLNEWLAANGFNTFAETGAAIVDDYIAQQWKFVVARVHRDNTEGLGAPHPLAVTFPADAPVYPMRLTRLAETDLRLNVFVISDKQVRADNMNTIYSDYFRYDRAFLQGRIFGAGLALPSLLKLAGERDCIITWLQADLDNAQLDRDFAIAEAPAKPERLTVYSGTGGSRAGANLLLAVGVTLALGAVVYVALKTRRARAFALLVTAVVAITAGAIAHAATGEEPLTVDVSVKKGGYHEDLTYWVTKQLREYPTILERMSRYDVENYFRNALMGMPNPVTGEPYALEEAPGDLVILSDENGIFVRAFGAHWPVGAPQDYRVTGEDPAAAQSS